MSARRDQTKMRDLGRFDRRESLRARVTRRLRDHLQEPTVCPRCGATYKKGAWRGRPLSAADLDRAAWRVCPSCKMVAAGEYYGRISIRGAYARDHEAAIRERIQNVEKRARFAQPQRRLVSLARDGAVLEVLTSSQRLAHRIVRELKKTFRGRASYSWSEEDGCLQATWTREQ